MISRRIFRWMIKDFLLGVVQLQRKEWYNVLQSLGSVSSPIEREDDVSFSCLAILFILMEKKRLFSTRWRCNFLFKGDAATHHHVNWFTRRPQGGNGIGCRETLRISRIMEYGPGKFQAPRKIYPPVSI